jgi:tetratricopeptide (TPR) repeat protein
VWLALGQPPPATLPLPRRTSTGSRSSAPRLLRPVTPIGLGRWTCRFSPHRLGSRTGKVSEAEAVKLMRAAADREDNSEKHVAMENRLYPMRELLADLLLEEGDAASALNEYETSMKNTPERVRGFYGAAKAAEAAGDKDKAAAYFRNLMRLARDADGDRAEIREARQFAVAK